MRCRQGDRLRAHSRDVDVDRQGMSDHSQRFDAFYFANSWCFRSPEAAVKFILVVTWVIGSISDFSVEIDVEEQAQTFQLKFRGSDGISALGDFHVLRVEN